MHLRHVLALAFASLLTAIPADGREIVLGVEQSLTGDSNLFNQSEEATADGSYRIGPTVRLLEDRDVVNYDFFYGPTYQLYMTTDDINGWNHTFRGNLTYRPTARDEIRLVSVALKRAAVQLLADPATGAAADVPGIGDTGRYTVELTYQRMFNERYSGQISAGYEQWTYSNVLAIPNISGFGRVAGYWNATPELQVGVDVVGRYRRFEEVFSLPESTNVILNANVFGQYKIDDKWTAVASLGPTYLAQRQEAATARETFRFRALEFEGNAFATPYSSCVPDPVSGVFFLLNCGASDGSDLELSNSIDPSETVVVDFPTGVQTSSTNSDRVTFFATAQIVYDFRRGSASLAYTRTQDASGGVASTNITDAITLTGTYKPSRRSALSLFTAWSNRQSQLAQERGEVTAIQSVETSDPPNSSPLAEADELAIVRVDTDREIMQLRLIATGTYQWTQNLRLGAQFSYTWQNVDTVATDPGTGLVRSSSNRDFNRYVGRVFVRYEFDPFRF